MMFVIVLVGEVEIYDIKCGIVVWSYQFRFLCSYEGNLIVQIWDIMLEI